MPLNITVEYQRKDLKTVTLPDNATLADLRPLFTANVSLERQRWVLPLPPAQPGAKKPK
jgi:hypothetical protein